MFWIFLPHYTRWQQKVLQFKEKIKKKISKKDFKDQEYRKGNCHLSRIEDLMLLEKTLNWIVITLGALTNRSFETCLQYYKRLFQNQNRTTWKKFGKKFEEAAGYMLAVGSLVFSSVFMKNDCAFSWVLQCTDRSNFSGRLFGIFSGNGRQH